MSLFIDPRTKKRKNPIVLISFLTAVLFLLIYGFFFTVLTDPLYRHVALGNPVLTTVVHGLIISLAGTAVCCLAFLLPDKRIVPLGFVALAVFLALSCVAAALLDADARSVMLGLIALYGLGPVVVGNAVAWSVYHKLLKTRRTESSAPESIDTANVSPVGREPTEEEALFGPDAGSPDGASSGSRNEQEEAALFYGGGEP